MDCGATANCGVSFDVSAGRILVFAAGRMLVLADENSPRVEAARGLANSSNPGVDGRCAGMVHVKSMFSCSPSTYDMLQM